MLKKIIVFIIVILLVILPLVANSETFLGLLNNKNDFEAFVVNKLQLRCKINKDKNYNRFYLEIYGNCKLGEKSSCPNITGPIIIPDFTKSIFEPIDNMILNEFILKSRIKISFKLCNKLYSEEIKKTDWDYDWNFHLYWNVDYNDVDFNKPLIVSLIGTINPQNCCIKEIKIFDYSK